MTPLQLQAYSDMKKKGYKSIEFISSKKWSNRRDEQRTIFEKRKQLIIDSGKYTTFITKVVSKTVTIFYYK